MKNKERIENGTRLSENKSGSERDGMSGSFWRELKLRMLKAENSYLEQHLAAMVLNNRALQSIRSKIHSFKI